jgi:hypothetical protein
MLRGEIPPVPAHICTGIDQGVKGVEASRGRLQNPRPPASILSLSPGRW